MELRSPKFRNGNPIPPQYTCDGINISPPLNFIDVPKESASLALIVEDPDAPNGTWVHWLIWNIPPHLTSIDEHFVMKGTVEGVTSFGRSGWGGPCPPEGVHRYFFKLYALDSMLQIPNSSGVIVLKKAMDGHIIKKAELMGTYTKINP